MPVLQNHKHEAFCQHRLEGKTLEQAYKLAGYKPSRQHAHKLSVDPRIVQRMKELHVAALNKVDVTVETITAQLDADRALAYKLKAPAAAIAATIAKAKLYGLMTERQSINVTHNYASMTEEELRFEIAALHAEARALKPGVQH